MGHVLPMSMAEIMDVVSGLTREDKVRVVSTLSRQLIGDYSNEEIEEIQTVVAEADTEFEQGKVLTNTQMASALGL